MLARAAFDQETGADFALAHARLLRALSRLPYGSLHRLLVAAAWLETWLRWPLRTLNILDGVGETFSLIDPRGDRFGLTRKARRRFRDHLLYHQLADLVVLLTSLERPAFRRRALTVENGHYLQEEAARGPGAIVAGFRLGAYPLVPWALAARGLPVSMIVGGDHLVRMGRGLGQAFLPRLTGRVGFISAQDPLVLTRCLGVLDRGGVAATLMELSPVPSAKTTDVDFLGWRVSVPYGLAYLAAATRRSIVPAVLLREEGPRFRLRFSQPLPPPERGREAVYERTQDLYRALERAVLDSPGQWIGWTLLGSHMGIELNPSATAELPTLS